MGRLIRNRLVPDPSITDAEYLYQKNRERERAESEGREPRLSIGRVWVEENAVSRIGALCFIRRREPHHEAAAEKFKGLYEARYGAGNPAIDPSRVIVDNSPIAHDSGMAAKIDRTVAIESAEKLLGKEAFNRLVALLVLEEPVQEGATILPSGEPNRRHVRKAVDVVLGDLDALSVIWGYRSRAA